MYTRGTNSGGITINSQGDWLAYLNKHIYKNGEKLDRMGYRYGGAITSNDNGDWALSIDSYVYKNRWSISCLLYTSPSPRDATLSRMPSSA